MVWSFFSSLALHILIILSSLLVVSKPKQDIFATSVEVSILSEAALAKLIKSSAPKRPLPPKTNSGKNKTKKELSKQKKVVKAEKKIEESKPDQEKVAKKAGIENETETESLEDTMRDIMDSSNLLKTVETLASLERSPDAFKVTTKDKDAEELEDVMAAIEKQSKNLLTNSNDTEMSNILTDVVNQIYSCWYVPAGSKDIAGMLVKIELELNSQASIIVAKVLPSIDDGNKYYQILKESALRALRNPECKKLKFPQERYEEWKNVIFTFNPENLIGQ